jgi:hypothetical protein
MSTDERVRRHLQQTTSSLTAPNRLEAVMAEGRRRQVRRGTFSVLGAAAVVAAVVTIAPLLMPDQEEGTFLAPVDTASDTSITQSTEPMPLEQSLTGAVLVGPEGVLILDREGTPVHELATDPAFGPMTAAYPDQTGGLIYQPATTPPQWPAGSILRLEPGQGEPTVLVSPSEGGSTVPIGPGISPTGGPAFYYVDETPGEETMVMGVSLDGGTPFEVTALTESVTATAGGTRIALIDRTDFECPRLSLIDVEAGSVPSPLGDDCLPVAAGVTLSSDGQLLAVLNDSDLQIVAVADGEVLVERSIPGAYMATAGPGGWAIRTPDATVLLSRSGETWNLPPVAQDGWAIPYARSFDLPEGAALQPGSNGATTEPTPDEASCPVVEAELPAQDLPEEVAATRQELWEMASACDRQGLATLAQQSGTILSFGGTTDPLAQWEAEADHDPVTLLAQLLTTRPAEDPNASLWVWPAAHVDPTDEESWAELEPLLGADVVDQIRGSGTGYTGYRVGIATDGTWQFFVAGD